MVYGSKMLWKSRLTAGTMFPGPILRKHRMAHSPEQRLKMAAKTRRMARLVPGLSPQMRQDGRRLAAALEALSKANNVPKVSVPPMKGSQAAGGPIATKATAGVHPKV